MALAASEIWLATAAVTRPSGTRVRNAAILAKLVSRRGPSSASTAPYGMISRSKRPSSAAAAARRWLSNAYSSISARLIPHFSAISSAARNWETSWRP